jgi:hypothetical protein
MVPSRVPTSTGGAGGVLWFGRGSRRFTSKWTTVDLDYQRAAALRPETLATSYTPRVRGLRHGLGERPAVQQQPRGVPALSLADPADIQRFWDLGVGVHSDEPFPPLGAAIPAVRTPAFGPSTALPPA